VSDYAIVRRPTDARNADDRMLRAVSRNYLILSVTTDYLHRICSFVSARRLPAAASAGFAHARHGNYRTI